MGSIKHFFSNIRLNSAPFVRKISAPSCSSVLKTYVGLCHSGSCGNHGGPGEEQEYITLEAKTVTDSEVRVMGLQKPACQPGHFRTGESQRAETSA